MALISLCFKWTIDCGNCGAKLPVNKAAERVLCSACGEETVTPLALWRRLVTPQLTEALDAKPESSTWANGMMAGLGSYSMEFGWMAPRCEGGCGAVWPLEQVLVLAREGAAHFACTGCGKVFSLRKVPDFFKSVLPFVQYAVGEEAPEAEGRFTGSGEGISMHCYHCGASLPLDGASRTITCQFCSNDLLIPDDIWQRLKPVTVAHFWYLLLDTGEHAGLFPTEIDDFQDLAAMPGGDTVLLWTQNSSGHLARSDRSGGLVWHIKDFKLADHSRLLYDRQGDVLWVLHYGKHLVYRFAAATGRMLDEFKQKRDEEGMISGKECGGAAVCSDSSLVVNRRWGELANTPVSLINKDGQWFYPPGHARHYESLRRFDNQGHRIPLWEGQADSEDDTVRPEFKTLAARANVMPHDALICGGPGHTLNVVDPASGRTVVFSRTGEIVRTLVPKLKKMGEIQDVAADADGSLLVLCEDKKEIHDDNFSHLGRISPEGKFTLLAGPRCKENPAPLGTGLEWMDVGPTGEIHLCDYRMGNFRVLDREGRVLWKSLSAYDEDEAMADTIAGRD